VLLSLVLPTLDDMTGIFFTLTVAGYIIHFTSDGWLLNEIGAVIQIATTLMLICGTFIYMIGVTSPERTPKITIIKNPVVLFLTWTIIRIVLFLYGIYSFFYLGALHKSGMMFYL